MVLRANDKYQMTSAASIDLDEPPPPRFQQRNGGDRKPSRCTRLEKLLLVALLVLTAVCIAVVVLVSFFIAREGAPAPSQKNCTTPTHQVYQLLLQNSSNQLQNDHAVGNNIDDGHLVPGVVTEGSHVGPNATEAPPPPCRSVCDTPQCVHVAYRMLNSMDPNVDPCQDFYSFACGGWQRSNSPDLEPRSVFAHNMVEKVDRALKELLEADGTTKGASGKLDDFEPFAKVRMLYSSCMLEDVIERRKFEPGKRLLEGIGNFHNNVTWNESNFDLTDLLANLLMNNGAPFFDVSYDVETESPLNLTIVISLPVQAGIVTHYKPNSWRMAAPPIGSHRQQAAAAEDVDNGEFEEFFQQQQLLGFTIDAEFILNYMKISFDRRTDERMYVCIRECFGRSANDTEQVALEDELRAFVSKLRDIVPSPKQLKLADDREETDKVFTLTELQLHFSQIDWKRFLQRLFGRPFKDDEAVKVTSPVYFHQLSRLFDDLGLRMVNNVALALFLRDVTWELMYQEKDAGSERWEFCVKAAKVALPDVLSAMYLRSFSREHLKKVQEDVDSMFQLIKKSFSRAVDDSSWIDEPTKKIADDKINSMKGSFIGAPILYNDTFLVEITSNVSLNEHLFFENVLQCYKLMRERMYAMYRLGVSDAESTDLGLGLTTNPFVVNAFYQYNMNKIVVALGLLSSPYYAVGEPKYVTYGSLGTTIGHEITHGFDITGVKYDVTGRKRSWLSESTRQGFDQRTGCIAHMYSGFKQKIKFLDTDVNINFDGNFTLNENFADNSGIFLAFQAYNLWLEHHGEEAVLPGLNLTSRQTLFLSAAQASCAVMTPLAYVFTLELDEHTPEPERVNAFLMNSLHFVDTFQCKMGTPMNAVSKCSLW